jgi:hypothetical protein
MPKRKYTHPNNRSGKMRESQKKKKWGPKKKRERERGGHEGVARENFVRPLFANDDLDGRQKGKRRIRDCGLAAQKENGPRPKRESMNRHEIGGFFRS